jgi:hypothetical protein
VLLLVGLNNFIGAIGSFAIRRHPRVQTRTPAYGRG